MGYPKKILGLKPKAVAPAPEYHVDPDRAKRMAAARSAALRKPLGRKAFTIDLEEGGDGSTRSGLVI